MTSDEEIVQAMAVAYVRERKRRENHPQAETWVPGPFVVDDMRAAFAAAEKTIRERCAWIAYERPQAYGRDIAAAIRKGDSHD